MSGPQPAGWDSVLDRTVLGGYTELGYRLRRHSWPVDDPAPGAMSGRTALITGANSGLGEAAARGMAALGAGVVLLVRDLERGQRAVERIRSAVSDARLTVARCDVSDPAAITEFAAGYRGPVDVLVHNAGVLPAQRTESVDGHEVTLATHVLGPLRLTAQLTGRLAESPDARVIFVSSGGMYLQPAPIEDPEYRVGRYRGAEAYARSKRIQVALLPEMARYWAPISIAAMHPGWVDTPGVATSLPRFRTLTRPLLRTPAEGADTIVWLAATAPPPPSGQFWQDRRVRPTHYLARTRRSDRELAGLWRYCAKEAGLNLG